MAFAPARAQTDDPGDGRVKDSVYFTMDDGTMSPQEMEEEAQYVYEQCTLNAYQNKYFDCGCLSGTFLIEREKRGPTMPQSDIVENMLDSPSSTCANTVNVAGTTYQECLDYRRTYYELATDNEDFCTCVGNKVANDFSKAPRLDSGLIGGLNMVAMKYCEEPANRKKKTGTASSAETNAGPKIPPKAPSISGN